jgi:hypothetical protein
MVRSATSSSTSRPSIKAARGDRVDEQGKARQPANTRKPIDDSPAILSDVFLTIGLLPSVSERFPSLYSFDHLANAIHDD